MANQWQIGFDWIGCRCLISYNTFTCNVFSWSRLGDLNPGPTHYERVSASPFLTGVTLRCSAFERGSASNSVTICGKSVAIDTQ